MDLEQLGRILLVIGGGLMLPGALFVVISRTPGLNRLGRMPGDIRIEGENFTCFAPIVSMIILSIVLTIILNLITRLLNR